MDSETRGLLRESIREVVTADPEKIVGALAELGWDEVVEADPAEATTLLFTEHGQALARSRVLDAVILGALPAGLVPHCDAVLYPVAAAGRAATGGAGAGAGADSGSGSAAVSATLAPVLAVACAPSGSAPGSGSGVLLGPVDPRAQVLVAVRGADGEIGLAVVAGSALVTTPLAGFDADRGLVRARLADPGQLSPTGGPAVTAAWTEAVAAGRRALVAEIIGVSRAALALAVEHTTSRVQFGQSIAAFQSVRHRLAEAHVSITAADTLLATAWAAGAADAPAARAAYAQAGRTAAVVTRHTVQVCGAMGAAQEFGLHRFVARAAVLSTLLGSYQAVVAGIGADLIATGAAPRLAEI